MRKVVGVALLAVIGCVIVAGCLYDRFTQSQSLGTAPGWDHAAFVEYLEEVFEPMVPLLEETGDVLDFERFRFFSSKDLNGKDETVVIVPLTADSPSNQLAFMTEEEAPLADIVPLPYGGFLALDPCTCFHTIENGVPYLYRILGYDVQAELVGAEGNFVRLSTEFSWTNRGAPIEGEWLLFRGNVIWHAMFCGSTTSNQK
ncbi:hypothetical protein KJ567_05750 [Candidatus Bipolaricaulota bacterium]|nr:hypothetical protein [Candidatus Bipolaricaulota bacterium]